MVDDNQLGKYIRRVRTERKIRINAVTPGSVAKLSRFENGKTNLSNEDLFTVMHRLGVGIDDLKPYFAQYQSPFIRFAEDFLRERREMTLARFNDLYRRYTSAQIAPGKLADINQLMFKALRAQLITKELVFLDMDVERQVANLLRSNADWLQYDYVLFTLAVPFLQKNTVLELFDQMVAEVDQPADPYSDLRAAATSEVVLTLLLRGATIELAEPVAELRRMHPQEVWGNDAVLKRYLLARADAVVHPDQENRVTEGLLQSFAILGLVKTSRYLRLIDAQIDQAEAKVND